MKKSLIAVLMVAVLVASFGVVGSVFAQSENPGYGYGSALQQQLRTEDGLGVYHDEIIAAFSEALGISVDDLEARIAAGETMADIALSEGLTLDEVKALMPAGSFGTRNVARMGRGMMAFGENSQYQQGPLLLGDGTCLEDGQPVREFTNQMGRAFGRGK